MRFNIFEGGNLRLTPWDPFYESGNRPADTHVEYAAHLKTKHKVVPFFFDNDSEAMQRYYRAGAQSDLIQGGIAVGDSLGLVLLAEGSFMEHLVFHNKKAVKGAKLKFTVEGVAAPAPIATLEATAVAAEAAADAADTAAATALGSYTSTLSGALTNQNNASAVTAAARAAEVAREEAVAARAAADEARKQADDAAVGIPAVAATLEVDLDEVGYHLLDLGFILQTNGMVAVELVASGEDGEGEPLSGFSTQCWTISPALIHHNDGHGCSCMAVPCETEYPDPEC